MFHHTVLDVATLCGVVLDVFVGAARHIYRSSNLPMLAQIESPAMRAVTASASAGAGRPLLSVAGEQRRSPKMTVDRHRSGEN
jgi:hypothetical protein